MYRLFQDCPRLGTSRSQLFEEVARDTEGLSRETCIDRCLVTYSVGIQVEVAKPISFWSENYFHSCPYSFTSHRVGCKPPFWGLILLQENLGFLTRCLYSCVPTHEVVLSLNRVRLLIVTVKSPPIFIPHVLSWPRLPTQSQECSALPWWELTQWQKLKEAPHAPRPSAWWFRPLPNLGLMPLSLPRGARPCGDLVFSLLSPALRAAGAHRSFLPKALLHLKILYLGTLLKGKLFGWIMCISWLRKSKSFHAAPSSDILTLKKKWRQWWLGFGNKIVIQSN